jgi:hypothetical protein
LIRAALLAVLAGSAHAGMMETGPRMADFSFVDGVPVYNLGPDIPDPSPLHIPEPKAGFIQPMIIRPDTDLGSPRLLVDEEGRALLDNDVTVLAAMPSVETQGLAERLRSTIEAMPPSTLGDHFSFLLTDQPLPGEVALRYRNIGVFTRVAGLDDAVWARDFDSSASLLDLSADAEQALRTLLPDEMADASAPATALLVLIGLVPLLLRRRRSLRRSP